MATAKDIERVILEVAGHPSSGAIKDLAPVMARLIVELDEPVVVREVDKRETR